MPKNIDIDKYKYFGYGIGFNRKGNFPIGNVLGTSCITFRVDMNLSVHLDNTHTHIHMHMHIHAHTHTHTHTHKHTHTHTKVILILGKGPTKRLDKTTLPLINCRKKLFN